MAIAIGTGGYFYYENQKKQIKSERERELLAISDLKVNQIANWRRECIADAEVLLENYILVQEIRNWLKTQEKSSKMEEILGWMSAFRGLYNYRSLFLLDEHGKVCLYTSEAMEDIGSYAKAFVKDAILKREIIFTDLYREESTHHIYLDILVPLVPRIPDGLPSGALVLRINPYQFLYPLIQSWPTPSETAETLLVKRDGVEVLYLNELRHQKNTALNLRLPLVGKPVSAIRAIHGVEGVIEEYDYRGVKVLAALRKIPSSPWYLIAKVDQDEMYAPIREQFVWVTTLVIIFILSFGAILGFFWRNQTALVYRKQYEKEIEHQALLKHFEYLTKYANDIILMTDRNHNIVEANDRAFEIYGYDRNELIGMDVRSIRSPEERPQFEGQFQQLDEKKSLLLQTVHQRKDGTTFPVEVSLRLIDVDGEKFYQGIIRDITERKRAEEEREKLIQELKETLAKVRTLSGLVPICASCKKIRDDKGYWNQIESYIQKHSMAEFSHGICPECAKKLYPDFCEDDQKSESGSFNPK